MNGKQRLPFRLECGFIVDECTKDRVNDIVKLKDVFAELKLSEYYYSSSQSKKSNR